MNFNKLLSEYISQSQTKMIYHILRIIAYLLTFVALNLIYTGIVDGFKNGIINNDGWIPTFSLIILLFIVSISTIILCNKKIKK